MNIELYVVVKFVSWKRIFRAVEKEVNFVFSFIRSAKGAEPILSRLEVVCGGGRHICIPGWSKTKSVYFQR